MNTILLEKINSNLDTIESWLQSYEQNPLIPIYLSTDIRDSGHKLAVVDANLFPAGFNNISIDDLSISIHVLRTAILRRIPHCKNIILFIENHTRNKWYLESVYRLKLIIEEAGFSIIIVTNNDETQEVSTQLEHTLLVHNAHNILPHAFFNGVVFDAILLNNDLTVEIPDVLKNINIPIIPPPQVGWHTRLKSCHFRVVNELLDEFSNLIGIDPWLVSCEYKFFSDLDVNNPKDLETISDLSSDLLQQVQKKYNEYNIQDNPYIILKSNNGTYGMGIIAVRDPQELKTLNRKKRNNLSVGKNSSDITSYILQEGIPTRHKVDTSSAEFCLYFIDNKNIGNFYRIHPNKNDYEILNSPGMVFQSIPQKDILHNPIFTPYTILSRIAGIACMMESTYLTSTTKIYENCLPN